MRVNAPEGWETTMRVAVGHGSFPPGQVGTTAGVTRFPNSGLFTIEEIADEEVADLGRGGKRLDDLEIDGTQVYHLVWTDEKGVDVERFATIAAASASPLVFTFANGESRAERTRSSRACSPRCSSAELRSAEGGRGEAVLRAHPGRAGPATRSTRPSMVARTTYCSLPWVTVASRVVASSQTTSLTAAADSGSLPLTNSTSGSPVAASRIPTVGEPGPS